jgi:hypothetical protein
MQLFPVSRIAWRSDVVLPVCTCCRWYCNALDDFGVEVFVSTSLLRVEKSIGNPTIAFVNMFRYNVCVCVCARQNSRCYQCRGRCHRARVTCDELKSLRITPLPATTTRARYVTSRVVAIRLYCAHTKIDRCSEREQRERGTWGRKRGGGEGYFGTGR